MHRKATKLIKIWISIPPVTCLTITAIFSFPSLLAGEGQSRSAVLAPAWCSNQALPSKTCAAQPARPAAPEEKMGQGKQQQLGGKVIEPVTLSARDVTT